MELYDTHYGYKLLITEYPQKVNRIYNNWGDMFEIAREDTPNLLFDFIILVETEDGNVFTYYFDEQDDLAIEEMEIDFL